MVIPRFRQLYAAQTYTASPDDLFSLHGGIPGPTILWRHVRFQRCDLFEVAPVCLVLTAVSGLIGLATGHSHADITYHQ